MEDVYIAWHIVGLVLVIVVGLVLAFRLFRKFEYGALFGLMLTYVYSVEGLVFIMFDPFSYMMRHDKLHRNEVANNTTVSNAARETEKPVIAPAAATIATLETVAVVLVTVNLLRLGNSYRRSDAQLNTMYQFAIGGAVVFTLFLTPRVLMYLGYFARIDYVAYSPVIGFWVVDSILECTTHVLAFVYAFMPALRLAYKKNCSIDPNYTINAHRAAEATWYAYVLMAYLVQAIAIRIISPLALSACVVLNSFRVVMGSLMMLALALPAPRFFAESLELKYASRLATAPNSTNSTPINTVRVTFVDGNGKHMSSQQGAHGSVLTVPVILASKTTNSRLW